MAAGSALNTRPLVSWKKHTHLNPCPAHSSAQQQQQARWQQAWWASVCTPNPGSCSRPSQQLPDPAPHPNYAMTASSTSKPGRACDAGGVQQHVDVAVAVRLGLHSERVALLQRQVGIIVG